jgi:hypothetical protein
VPFFKKEEYLMKTIDMRLQEAVAILETLCDQEALTQADLGNWEQELQTALSDAQRRDQDELQYWLTSDHYYRTMLQQWMFRESEAARAALARRKRLGYLLLIFLACWCSAGTFLIFEIKTIHKLQARRDCPPFGEQQRLWIRLIQDAERNVRFLRSLQAPRLTPRLRECNQEVFSRHRRLDSLGSQIQIQQTRIQVLQQQRAQQP